jgi:hypothetical protein
MNGCSAMQARFSEYLDGRLTGREMQRIASHLDLCRACGAEWTALRQTQSSLAALGPVKEPEDLLLRIRVAVSQERARSRKSQAAAWRLAWANTVGPFLLQATAGFASAVLLLGTVIVLVTMFAQPETVAAQKDVPLGNMTAPRLLYVSTNAGNTQIGDASGPIVVEASINGAGFVYDYRIVSGPIDADTRAQVENLLLWSAFEPARRFGQPVRGLAVISYSGVSVRG